jgi:hypothetical protein
VVGGLLVRLFTVWCRAKMPTEQLNNSGARAFAHTSALHGGEAVMNQRSKAGARNDAVLNGMLAIGRKVLLNDCA